MPKCAVSGYPRVGRLRELKFWTEDYFKGALTEEQLLQNASRLQKEQWLLQEQSGIDFIPSNDFSLYDGMLDTAVMLGAVPAQYSALGLSPLGTYFAMARGYQGKLGDVRALSMRKWFNTNYHYIVPVLGKDTALKLSASSVTGAYAAARAAGVDTRPVLIGPLTFLLLSSYEDGKRPADFAAQAAQAYAQMLTLLGQAGAQWVQIDEPILCTDLTAGDISLFERIYRAVLAAPGRPKVTLQTYFGDVRDAYSAIIGLPFEGVGLDFCEGKKNTELIKTHGFPQGRLLFAGVVNGKNIWKNDYQKSLKLLGSLAELTDRQNIVVSTCCSLLHSPYTLQHETKLSESALNVFAFAEEKLAELAQLKRLFHAPNAGSLPEYIENRAAILSKSKLLDAAVQAKVSALTERDFVRLPGFEQRQSAQAEALKLPPLPTTTIGSFPQTAEVKAARAKLKKNQITKDEYSGFIRQKIAQCIELQEQIGLDVLVHGEYERGDMVEYFGENLSGFLFTQKGWVQSYGTRCVKPPIIFGDVSRAKTITVELSAYAQSLTDKPVKGMLTGPVTILNWSFPREDIAPRESALQIALAIREEAEDLERAGIRIIQVDEAALKEKLPLRRADWHSDYLDWAIPAFRLVHSRLKPQTQLHTHMCYSEFQDIVKEIDDMDADVISFEAARSNMALLPTLKQNNFRTQVGPGVYDIHSPRVPSPEEMEHALELVLEHLPPEKVWANPDCGLKTRGERETAASLQNMVTAAKYMRAEHLDK